MKTKNHEWKDGRRTQKCHSTINGIEILLVVVLISVFIVWFIVTVIVWFVMEVVAMCVIARRIVLTGVVGLWRVVVMVVRTIFLGCIRMMKMRRDVVVV